MQPRRRYREAALTHYGEAAAINRAGYREALAIYRRNERTPPLDLANALRGFALLKGRSAEANALWQEARDLYAAVGVEAGVAESSGRLAE